MRRNWLHTLDDVEVAPAIQLDNDTAEHVQRTPIPVIRSSRPFCDYREFSITNGKKHVDTIGLAQVVTGQHNGFGGIDSFAEGFWHGIELKVRRGGVGGRLGMAGSIVHMPGFLLLYP